MTESALKNFFDENISLEELRNDLKGTIKQSGNNVLSYSVDTLSGTYKIRETHILKLCEAAINENLDSIELDVLSFALIGSDFFEWDSERISETLADWNNQDINYPITKKNLELWKQFLLTGKYQLSEYNNWNAHIESQKAICQQLNTDWNPINYKLKIGVGGDLSNEPWNGLRHPEEQGTTGWFIWSGEYSERADFFKPMCAEHLLQMRPELIRFLGLPTSFRFLADNKGYVDIWRDDKLLEI
jgi:hypothetical protein